MASSGTRESAPLIDCVRATQNVEFSAGDGERIAKLLAATKRAFEALADQPRFDGGEPADLVNTLRRLAPAGSGAAGGDAS